MSETDMNKAMEDVLTTFEDVERRMQDSYNCRYKMNKQVIIYYNKYCPYAQRALITAIEKNIQVEFVKTGLG